MVLVTSDHNIEVGWLLAMRAMQRLRLRPQAWHIPRHWHWYWHVDFWCLIDWTDWHIVCSFSQSIGWPHTHTLSHTHTLARLQLVVLFITRFSTVYTTWLLPGILLAPWPYPPMAFPWPRGLTFTAYRLQRIVHKLFLASFQTIYTTSSIHVIPAPHSHTHIQTKSQYIRVQCCNV